MSSKKVSIFMPDFNPGGAEHVMVSLANFLIEKGYLVEFIVIKPQGPLIERLDKRIVVTSLNSNLIKSIFPLIGILRKSKRDVLISTLKECNLYSIIGRFFTKKDFKLIIREANTPSAEYAYENTLKDKVKNFLVRRLYKKADQVIALSELMKNDLIKQIGVCEKKVSVIGNPVDTKNIEKMAKESLTAPEKFFFDSFNSNLIISVGRFSKVKNFEFGLDFLHCLNKEGMRYGYVIVGDGSEKPRLMKKVISLGLEKQVFFTGYQKNPFKYLYRGDIFFMPSLYEGLPNVLLQAISLKLRVLVSDSPGAGPFLTRESKSGLVYSYNDLNSAIAQFHLLEKSNFDLNSSSEYVASNYDQEKVLITYLEKIDKEAG